MQKYPPNVARRQRVLQVIDIGNDANAPEPELVFSAVHAPCWIERVGYIMREASDGATVSGKIQLGLESSSVTLDADGIFTTDVGVKTIGTQTIIEGTSMNGAQVVKDQEAPGLPRVDKGKSAVLTVVKQGTASQDAGKVAVFVDYVEGDKW